MPRDLTIHRIGLQTIFDDLEEVVGDQLEVVGAAVAAGERQARPMKFSVPIYAAYDESQGRGDTLRRQLRSLLDNPLMRLPGVYVALTFDPELDSWMVFGDGVVKYVNGGVTFDEYRLDFNAAYNVGQQRTHREARRLFFYNRMLASVPRDQLARIFSTDFAAILSPLYWNYVPASSEGVLGGKMVGLNNNAFTGTKFPIGAENVNGSNGTLGFYQISRSFGGPCGLSPTGLAYANGAVFQFDPPRINSAGNNATYSMPLQGRRSGDVRIYDSFNNGVGVSQVVAQQVVNPQPSFALTGFGNTWTGINAPTTHTLITNGASEQIFPSGRWASYVSVSKAAIATAGTIGSQLPLGVSAEIAGLTAGTTYYARGEFALTLAAANGNWSPRLRLDWYNGASLVSTSFITGTVMSALNATQLVKGSAVCPATATAVSVGLEMVNNGTSQTVSFAWCRTAFGPRPEIMVEYPGPAEAGYAFSEQGVGPSLSLSVPIIQVEEIFGPNHPIGSSIERFPVVENGLIRIKPRGSGGSPTSFNGYIGVDVNWNGRWYEAGKIILRVTTATNAFASVLPNLYLRESQIIEHTPEHTVLRVRAGQGGNNNNVVDLYLRIDRGTYSIKADAYLLESTGRVGIFWEPSANIDVSAFLPHTTTASSIVKCSAAPSGFEWPTVDGAVAMAATFATATYEPILAMIPDDATAFPVTMIPMLGSHVPLTFLATDGFAYSTNRKGIGICDSTDTRRSTHVVINLGQPAAWMYEAEAIRNTGSGTTSQVADAAATGGQCVLDTQLAATAATLTVAGVGGSRFDLGVSNTCFFWARVKPATGVGTDTQSVATNQTGGVTVTTADATQFTWQRVGATVSRDGATITWTTWRSAGTGVAGVKIDRVLIVPMVHHYQRGAREAAQMAFTDMRQSIDLVVRA